MWQAMVTLGVLYLVVMLVGALGYRVAPQDWHPRPTSSPPNDASPPEVQNAGQEPPAGSRVDGIPDRSVGPREAMRTRAFWLLWAVLGLNVTAGIGVLAVASPMLQEIFGGALIGQPGVATTDLAPMAKAELAAMGAGFVGLLSLFNIGGRFVWASLSDRLGRKATYAIFFALGATLYAVAAWAASAGSLLGFTVALCVVLSMYGGGFATVPAYLSDLFGTGHVGAIHGRLLTAWSVAGLVGPILVAKIREARVEAGLTGVELYAGTLRLLGGLLVLGLICNLLIPRPAGRGAVLAADPGGAPGGASTLQSAAATSAGSVEHDAEQVAPASAAPASGQRLLVTLTWLAVGLPLVWGVTVTLAKVAALFG